MSDIALALSGVTKRFGDTLALDACGLTVRRGTVHALLGENGAGKTTLMRVAFGMIRPDAGAISVDGLPKAFATPAAAIEAGIGMVHQHFTSVPAMTVAENVALGHRGRFSREHAESLARRVADRASMPLDPRALAGSLSVENQQRLEIVKALAREATLLILDEPTAVLAPAQSAELLRWVRQFAAAGNSVVLITHKLQEALGAADDVTVLRRGRTVLEAPADAITASALAAALLGDAPAAAEGSEPSAMHTEALPGAGDPVVTAARISIVDDQGMMRVRDASFAISPREIIGVVGVEGAGQHELLRAVARRVPVSGGTIIGPPASRIAFVPEDRHRDALILDLSATENFALRGAGARRGVMHWRRWNRRARALALEYDVRLASVDDTTRTMSGGNQQKLVLARELADAPALVVAENPTRGLDIRASSFVHDRLRAAALAGSAVIVYSTDFDEVLALATRLLVAYAGRIESMPVDRERAGRAMLGLA